MRIFLIASIAFACSAGTVSAHEHSPGEIAWGKAAAACLQKHSESRCKVVVHPETKSLTIWCPKGTDKSIPQGCSDEANQSAQPAEWRPK